MQHGSNKIEVDAKREMVVKDVVFMVLCISSDDLNRSRTGNQDKTYPDVANGLIM